MISNSTSLSKLSKLLLPKVSVRATLPNVERIIMPCWSLPPFTSCTTPISLQLGANPHSPVWARKAYVYGQSSSCYIIPIEEEKRKEKEKIKGNSVSDPWFCGDTIRNMIQECWLNAVCSCLEMSVRMSCHMIFTHFYSKSFSFHLVTIDTRRHQVCFEFIQALNHNAIRILIFNSL